MGADAHEVRVPAHERPNIRREMSRPALRRRVEVRQPRRAASARLGQNEDANDGRRARTAGAEQKERGEQRRREANGQRVSVSVDLVAAFTAASENCSPVRVGVSQFAFWSA